MGRRLFLEILYRNVWDFFVLYTTDAVFFLKLKFCLFLKLRIAVEALVDGMKLNPRDWFINLFVSFTT